jgi:hypothetical protein
LEWLSVNAGGAFQLDFDFRPTKSVPIMLKGEKIGTLDIQPNPRGYWRDGTYASRAGLLLQGRGPRYIFNGGIAMKVTPSNCESNDFSFVQTYFYKIGVLQYDQQKGMSIWRNQSIHANLNGDGTSSSLSNVNPGINYYVDADTLLQTNPNYPPTLRNKGAVYFVDYPTATRGLITTAREDFPDAEGVSAVISFTTYVVYKKTIVARVGWNIGSTWYSSWFKSDVNYDILHLMVSLGTVNSNLTSNPMTPGERLFLKHPDQ